MEAEDAKIIYDVPSEERNWAVLSHLCSFLIFVPFASLVGPLVIWKLNKESSFVSKNAVAALNFQITVTIGSLIGGILAFILIGYLVIGFVALASMVFSVIAALKAADKQIYHYPYSFHFVTV